MVVAASVVARRVAQYVNVDDNMSIVIGGTVQDHKGDERCWAASPSISNDPFDGRSPQIRSLPSVCICQRSHVLTARTSRAMLASCTYWLLAYGSKLVRSRRLPMIDCSWGGYGSALYDGDER